MSSSAVGYTCRALTGTRLLPLQLKEQVDRREKLELDRNKLEFDSRQVMTLSISNRQCPSHGRGADHSCLKVLCCVLISTTSAMKKVCSNASLRQKRYDSIAHEEEPCLT